MGGRVRSVNESVARRRVYGEGYGAAIGYDAIQRQLRPTQTALAKVRARIEFQQVENGAEVYLSAPFSTLCITRINQTLIRKDE